MRKSCTNRQNDVGRTSARRVGVLFGQFDRTPDRRTAGRFGISAGQQNMELVRFQRTNRGIASWPVGEFADGKTFLAKPVPLAVIEENLDGGSLAIAEDKRAAGHGVLLELLATRGGETINALAKINGLRGDKDPHGGAGLDHRAALLSHNTARTDGSCATAWPFSET